jgi:hypothetical protein
MSIWDRLLRSDGIAQIVRDIECSLGEKRGNRHRIQGFLHLLLEMQYTQ